MLCFRTNSCVSSFFSQNPGRSWRPPWCSKKEGLRLLKPRPFSPSPRPLLHRRTPPARFHSNHNETMRLLGDPPPPRLDSLWGGRRPLYFFLLFLLFRQIHSIHSSFSPPCPGNSSNPSTVSRNWTIKTIPEGGKVPTKQKGPDLETCLDFLWEQRIDLIGWNLLQDLLNGPMVRCWWWRDYTFLFTGEKKKKRLSFKPRPLWIWRDFSHWLSVNTLSDWTVISWSEELRTGGRGV